MLITEFLEQENLTRDQFCDLVNVSSSHLANLICYKRQIAKLDDGNFVLVTNNQKFIYSFEIEAIKQ